MDNFNSEKLYDLLVQNTFENLTEEEKFIVLQAMSVEEFAALKNLNKAVSGLNQSRKESIEELLLKKLPAPKSAKLFWNHAIPIWQAASILVLAITGLFLVKDSNKKETGLQTAMIDTVWVEKPVEKRITDTVYVWHTKTKSNPLHDTKTRESQRNEAKENHTTNPQSNVSAPTSILEHRNRLNSLSLIEDSILLNIGFVRL